MAGNKGKTWKVVLFDGYRGPAKVGGYSANEHGLVPKIGEKVEIGIFCFGSSGRTYLPVRDVLFKEGELPQVCLDRNEMQIRDSGLYSKTLEGFETPSPRNGSEEKRIPARDGVVDIVLIDENFKPITPYECQIKRMFEPTRGRALELDTGSKLGPERVLVVDILYPRSGLPKILVARPRI